MRRRRQLCWLGLDVRIVFFVSDEFGHLLVLVHDIELYALFVVMLIRLVVRLADCAEDNSLRGYETFVVFAVNCITDLESREY